MALREIADGLISEQVIAEQEQESESTEDELLIALGEELAELQNSNN